MSLSSNPIPNFVNGISQQPYTVRLSSQGERQENALSTPSSGLRKRPPTEHLAKVSSTPVFDASIHLVDRDQDEKYVVVITNGNIQVYDLAGNEKTVVITDTPYLNTTLTTSESFSLVTVADYTFVVNKSVVVQAATTSTPTRAKEAIISVRQGAYGKTYSVRINGTQVASFLTPNGTDAAAGTPPQVEQVATDFIAGQLVTQMIAAGYQTGPWTLTQNGSVIVLTRTDGVDFGISCEDGLGNTAMVALKGQLQNFTDLPPNPRFNGFTIEIVGDRSSDFDNYWVKFSSNTTDGSGVWEETVAPGINTGVNPLTMPHQLIRQADGTFTFGPATWEERKVGDSTSSPDPSFVGRTINAVFFFQNRLGFLSDENYVQSEAGKYFNVFRTTVTALLDSDPLDVNAATNKVAILEHAVPFNRQLLLFSAQQQFVVDSAELMTPKKVPLKPTTEFPVNTLAKPVAAGRNVYFATDKGQWSAVREFFAQDINVGDDATDITGHVPKYVPSDIVKIAAGTTEDVLVLLSSTDRAKLYVYKYYFSNNEKLQSSWSEFNFAAGTIILSCDFVSSVLYLLITRGDGVYLEKMDFSLGAAVTGEPYQVLLDRKVQIGTASLSFDGTSTIINGLPYAPTDGTYMVVAHGGGTIKAGQLATVTYAGGVASVNGDLTASPLAFGSKYLFRFTLSKLLVRTPLAGGGMAVETAGRTQVRRILFNYDETGYVQALVTPEARQTYTYTFAGKLLGTPSAQIGGVSLPSGTWSVPVRSRNTTTDITLESDMPLPVSILGADWEAFFVKRS